MPSSKSKSKSNARVVRYGSLTEHPAVRDLDPLLQARLGGSEPIRLPDAYAEPTAAVVLKDEYTITSDAAGQCFFAESYNLSGSRLASVITTGTLGGITTTAHPQYTSFTAEAKVARMVMMRIQVMYIGREDSASGYLSFDKKTETAFGGTTMDSHHVSSVAQFDAQHGAVVTLGYTQEPRWEVPTSSTFMNNTYSVPAFFGTALPVSTPVYRVRVWRFLEYLPFDGAISEGNMASEPHQPSAGVVHGMLNGIATSISTFIGWDDFKVKLMGAANAAYHIAAPLTPWVVGKAKAYLKNQALSSGLKLAAGALLTI